MMFICFGEEETSADNCTPDKKQMMNTEGTLLGEADCSDQYNNSHDPTLLHNVIKPLMAENYIVCIYVNILVLLVLIYFFILSCVDHSVAKR